MDELADALSPIQLQLGGRMGQKNGAQLSRWPNSSLSSDAPGERSARRRGAKERCPVHGMAGAGKTACAVELTYHHQAARRFQAFAWYRAPEADKDIQLALRDFALAMERQLPGFAMVHVVDSAAALQAWLPRLTQLLEDNSILLVLDNLESLLSASGQWRDERWGMLVDALLKPGGLSRVMLTSRTRPVGPPTSIEAVTVHALPLDEALLLVRELPNFRICWMARRRGSRSMLDVCWSAVPCVSCKDIQN